MDAELTKQETQSQAIEAIKHLHPYAALLGVGDVESCVLLENATFPENQRASREKVGEPFQTGHLDWTSAKRRR